MSNYVDLVLVKHDETGKKYLFQAPGWSYLDEGTKVIVDTCVSDNEPAEVVASYTIDPSSEEFKFICEAAGATLPLKKVVAKVRLSVFKYDDEEEQESGT